jgi:hypothetical protein
MIELDDHFRVEVTSDAVRAWATRPLPFEVNGWTKQFRAGLVAGLRALVGEGSALEVDVWDRKGWIHDLENAAIYNVGTAPFARFLPAGIRLRRRAGSFLPAASLRAAQVAAEYSYRLVVPSDQPVVAGREVLEWSFRLDVPIDVRAVWRSARTALCAGAPAVNLAGRRLGLRVEAPAGLTAGAMKPLLDGVIAAMHIADHDGVSRGVLVGWGADDAEAGLLTNGPAPLGPRRLITLAGQRASWNPADDLVDDLAFRCAEPGRLCRVYAYGL